MGQKMRCLDEIASVEKKQEARAAKNKRFKWPHS